MPTKRKMSVIIIPFVIAAAVAVAAIFYILSEEHQADRTIAQAVTTGVAEDLHGNFLRDVVALEGFRAFWLGSQKVLPEEFATYAASIQDRLPEFTAMEWVDTGNIVRYVYPLEGENLKAVDLDNNKYPTRLRAIEDAKSMKMTIVSSPIIVVQGFPGLVMYAPIYRGDRYEGAMVGVVKLSALLGGVPGVIGDENYDFQVRTGDKIISNDGNAIYTTKGERIIAADGTAVPDPDAPAPFPASAASSTVTFGNQTWEIRLQPRGTLLSPEDFIGALGILFLLANIIMARMLLKKQAALEEANDRERDFVALVSHQLRIPLTELSWMIDSVFETSTGMTEEQSTTIQEIRGIIRGSIKLVSDLLNVSRIDRGVLEMHCEEVLIADLVGETIKPLVRMADERGVKIAVSVPEKLTAYADSQKAIEAMRNIIDNALKYGPGNSTIEIGAKEADGYVTISIRDHGPGIAKEIRSKIFDKASAYSTKGTKDGAGLGLFLTKEFIDLMGGEVKFETSAKGTVFLVSLSQEKTAACLDKEVSQ